MRRLILFSFLLSGIVSFGQKNYGSYKDSLQKFREQYISTHDVVKGDDTSFLQFFPIDENYRVFASFERIHDSIGFGMNTSAGVSFKYFKFGKATFNLKGKTCQLYLYRSAMLMRSPKYKDHLFIPFADETNGDETHGSGRFIDFTVSDIRNNVIEIDFNKAYNPSCAYKEGYACPIPPKENTIKVEIKAGEKIFGKPLDK
ncbi:DUF1684 domain-containing protein [Ferruginibacter albus]|uniref:DUF1684 domain-containing protein n=1 Tax=Ferruginibacter albus TaxID=2875540 RepID=UPI001CC6FDBA|nr:DUF1684 domain-containing protein [Ferruginibacter albus]UAY51260.1 DUF1684 domain-containing protein [Ferruginibacter albus]